METVRRYCYCHYYESYFYVDGEREEVLEFSPTDIEVFDDGLEQEEE